MRIPVLQGVIDRRILANFRVRLDVLEKLLPAPFRPKAINGWGMAGICLIRLKNIRPHHVPGMLGMTSENAAHRVAVQWTDANGAHREGVYIFRRDSSSLFNSIAGGRLFPGVHHRAHFDVKEDADNFRIEIHSNDKSLNVLVDATVTEQLPTTSIFSSLPEASAFFEAGAVGYSPANTEDRFDGLELRSEGWKVEPLNVRAIRSSFFEDTSKFPSGSTEFDCALLMRGINHEWHDCGQLSADSVANAP